MTIVAGVSRPLRYGLLIATTAALLAACTSSPPNAGSSIPTAPEFESFVAAHGGMHIFGPAIEQRREDSGRVRQAFANAELVFDPALPAGTQVALTPLGYSLGLASPAVPRLPGSSYFESTGHALDPRLQAGFDSAGGSAVVGAPIAEAVARGAHLVQYFENLGLRLPLEGSSGDFEFLAYGFAAHAEIRPPAGVVLPPDARTRPFALFLDPYGGESVFGRALSEPYAAPDGALEQVFANTVLYAPTEAPGSVRLRGLGSALGPPDPPVTGPSDTVGLYVPDSGHYVLWAFATFYRAHGGEVVLGLPLEEGKTVDGVLRQRFENVILEYRPELPPHLAVQLSPLGIVYAAASGQPGGDASATLAAPGPVISVCSGVASVTTQPQQAILPSAGIQHIQVVVLRPDGQPWSGVTPMVVVHTPSGDLYPPVPPADGDGRTAAAFSVEGLRPGEVVNYEVVVAAEQCTGYAIGQFAAGL